MKTFHVFIHPNQYGEKRDSEGGAPVVLMDAQATGMPVLSTFHCDIPIVVIHGVTGILVKEKDVNGLAEAIKKFYDMEESVYLEYCEQARKHIEENCDSVGIRLKKIYETIILEQQRCPGVLIAETA